MKKIIFLILMYIWNCNLSIYAQMPDWYIKLKQISPIVSTKADVEKFFGAADRTRIIDNSTRILSSYNLEDGWLSITYSNGECKADQTAGYNIPKETVETVFFTTKKPIKLSLLKIKLKGFYSSSEDDVEIQIFTNFDEGVEYAVSNKQAGSIKFFPARKYDSLRCAKK